MHSKPLLVALVALIAFAAAFLAGPRPANAEDPTTITVSPAAPTSQDAVSITVAGDLHSQFCGMDSMSFVKRADDAIVIYLFSAAQVCSLILRPTTFSVTEQIGPLPSGEYTVFVFSNEFDELDYVEVVPFQVNNLSVGGITELPRLERELLVAGSSDVHAGVVAGIVAAAAVGVLALGGAAWYTKKRLAN